MKINTVTIIGANGTLGIGVASIFAAFGETKVYMIARTKDKAENAMKKVGLEVRANSICENLEPKTYNDLKECIQKSDIVVETVVEELEVKRKIHQEIDKYLKSSAVTASVTSGISINKLAECYNGENRKRFFGVHFFNPPYSLQLCELIASKDSDKDIEEDLQKYLESILYRKVIKVKDEAGFLANRIGFQFINKAMQYADRYKRQGGIDYIDNILGCFTGRNMPPLYTADFVGLDVHKAIVDNIYSNTNDYAHKTFKLPEFAECLINSGKLGTKTQIGLYNKNREKVFDIEKKVYREIRKYKIEFIDKTIENLKIGNYNEAIKIILEDNSKEAMICRKMLINYIIYSFVATREVGYDLLDCDIAMAEGFNWIPPFSLLKLIGKDNFKNIAIELFQNCDEYIKEIYRTEIKSNYRYEKYLKAKR